MKYIQKSQKEPDALLRYRTQTPNASYKGYIDRDPITGQQYPLKLSLLEEQGYLCAYCMGRISLNSSDGKPDMEVEHYLSQALFPGKTLSYRNMLAVCNGFSVTHPEKECIHHCDKTKGTEGKMNGQVRLRKLDPLDKRCEQLLTYSLYGKVLSISKDDDIEHDLTKVLNLNNASLCSSRKFSLDAVRAKMEKDKPIGNWNKQFIQKYIDNYSQRDKDNMFTPYCMIILWFLERLMKKNRD